MSRLEELIQELCPNGVEFLSIEKVIFSLNTGLNPRKFFRLNTDDAMNYYVTIREIHNNKIEFSDTTDRINDEALRLCNNRSNLEIGDVIFSGTGTIGETALITETPRNWNIKEGVYVIKPNPKRIISRFLMYLLQSNSIRVAYMKKVSGGTVKSIPMKELRKIIIPVPPLEVQREIVRILDHFTELTTELTARKKQYEYYRNQLLTFSDDIKCARLGDTCYMKAGKALSARLINDKPENENPFPCYGGNGIRGYVNRESHHGEFPIIGRQGALCGNVNYARGNFYATEHAIVVESKGNYLQRFLYYLLTSMNINQYKSKGAQPGLAVKTIENLLAPLPPLEEQQRIVDILDRFDTLCNDLTAGLPAEIEARQKQYEYYRDKLLTFEPLAD